jgi:hypothetical protein
LYVEKKGLPGENKNLFLSGLLLLKIGQRSQKPPHYLYCHYPNSR